MRYCPFCSAENLDEVGECTACARRLPPLPSRRRKNGLERTAPIRTVLPSSIRPGKTPMPGGLGPKLKGLADIAPSPAAGRRKATKAPPLPEGATERRKATARPTGSGRRQTMPPIPSREARDLRASLSTGVAPGLASETIPLPLLATHEVAVSAPEPAVPAPKVFEAQSKVASVEVGTSDSDSDSEQWPAPVTSASAHPDDWSLETEEPMPDAVTTQVQGSEPAAQPAAPKREPNKASVVEDQSQAELPVAFVSLSEPFKAPELLAIPSVPEAGLYKALRYTIAFERARWQRRGAIKTLQEEMRLDTGMLDGILGALGKQARALQIDGKAFAAENKAILEAEGRRKTADHECSELSNRQAEEKSKFANNETERLAKVKDAESSLQSTETELAGLETQSKSLREKKKSLETRKKGYLKAAENREQEGSKEENSGQRLEMRQGAQTLRNDAAELDKERQEMEGRLAALEQPTALLNARLGALKSDLDSAKRALTDLREGHRHRLAEIEAEQGRKSRELAQAEAEIQRREVTLGTLVNLNRVERPEFLDLYGRIDSLRGGIGARSNEIDKLAAEREAYDKASRLRGALSLAGLAVLALAVLAILMSLF